MGGVSEASGHTRRILVAALRPNRGGHRRHFGLKGARCQLGVDLDVDAGRSIITSRTQASKSWFTSRWMRSPRVNRVGTISLKVFSDCSLVCGSTRRPVAVASMLLSAPSRKRAFRRFCQRHFKDDGFIIQYCMTAVSRRIAIEYSDGNLPSGYTPPLRKSYPAMRRNQCSRR